MAAIMPSLLSSALLLLPLLQAAAATPAPVVDDVRRLTAASSNDERFDAVTALLTARGLPFTVEAFTPEKPAGKDPRTRGRNIVVTLGDGPGFILIGAHYDAVYLEDGSLSHGAVDNAASAVLLVRLADALRRERPPVPVRLVWFDMEEGGLIGSQHYAAAHPAERPVAMLNFDINGYGDTVIFGQPQGSAAPAIERAMGMACAAEAIDCLRSRMPPGDDRTFGKTGIPTLSIGVLPALEAHQAWLTFNAGQKSGLAPGSTLPIMTIIHHAADTIDKVDAATVERQARLAGALVRAIAAAPPR
jgi:Iap family predicted aminopeptidase